MPDQGGIQLLPETRRKIDIKTPGENRWLYAGAVALILAVSIAAGLAYYRGTLESTLAGLDADLTSLENQRDKKVEQNLLTLSKQLSMTTRLLSDHVFWSKALAKTEALTQPRVQFSAFSADAEEGVFQIKAYALNYTSLAKQIASYVSEDSIEDIDLSDVHVLTDGRLEFTIRLKFDKDKFVKDNEPQ